MDPWPPPRCCTKQRQNHVTYVPRTKIYLPQIPGDKTMDPTECIFIWGYNYRARQKFLIKTRTMCHVFCLWRIAEWRFKSLFSNTCPPTSSCRIYVTTWAGLCWSCVCLTMSRLKIIYVSHSSCLSSSARMARSVSRNIRSVTTGASARTTRTKRIAVSFLFTFFRRG